MKLPVSRANVFTIGIVLSSASAARPRISCGALLSNASTAIRGRGADMPLSVSVDAPDKSLQGLMHADD